MKTELSNLISIIENTHIEIEQRIKAINSLVDFNNPIIPHLLNKLINSSKEKKIASAAKNVLNQILGRAFYIEGNEKTEELLNKIKLLVNEKRTSELIGLFYKTDLPWLKATIVSKLGEIQDKHIIPILTDLLYHECPRVRANAIEALEKLNPPEFIKYIRPLLYDNDNRVKANAVRFLFLKGRMECIQELMTLITSSDESSRLSAIFLLKALKNDFAKSQLKTLAEDKNPEVQKAAKDALKDFENSEPTNNLPESDESKNQDKSELKLTIFFFILLIATFFIILIPFFL